MLRWTLILGPLTLAVLLIALFTLRLVKMNQGDMPDDIQTVLTDKPAPEFALPALSDAKPGLQRSDFEGKVTLVNFFASWCGPCRSEHPLLSGLAGKVNLVGIAYKNDPAEAKAWLANLGDPYSAIALDREGRVAIDFGVYGVPETYLIDKQGRIRYVWKKPFTQGEITGRLLPMIKDLQK